MSTIPTVAGEDSLRLRARCREMMLLKAFHLFTDSWPTEDQNQIALNQQVLRMVSESYFKDLERKKNFHGIQYADEHKRAGYMLKWIMRFRPIQLVSENCGVSSLLANEHFALTVALRIVRVAPTKLNRDLYKNLIYALRYRHIDANAWALSFFLLQKCHP